MLKRLGANIAAGAVSSCVSILAGIVSVPLYLALVGKESFGVIGFFLTIQAALLVLDGGIAVSATRLVAQAQTPQNDTANLLRGLASVTWWIGVTIAVLLGFVASSLARRWLNLSELDPAYVMQALVIAGIAIGARWPLSLYQSVLTGKQAMITISAINVAMTLLSTGGALALMAWVTPDLRLLFGWLAATALIQVLWSRAIAIQLIGRGRTSPWDAVLRFFRLSAPAGWLGLVGLLLMQVDKLVLSRMVSLDLFGYYVMATMAAGALYALVTPVFNVLYPRFASLAASGSVVELRQFYRSSSLALATLLCPVAAVLAFFADSILLLWTGDPTVASAASLMVCLLSLGTALHGIMFAPYALKLACGASRLALAISAAMLVLSLLVTVFMALRWGGTGAAAAWLTLNVVYVLLGSAVTHRRLMPGLGYRWLMVDVGPPALLSLTVVWMTSQWIRDLPWSHIERVELGAGLVLACWLVLACASNRLREASYLLITGKTPGLNLHAKHPV